MPAKKKSSVTAKKSVSKPMIEESGLDIVSKPVLRTAPKISATKPIDMPMRPHGHGPLASVWSFIIWIVGVLVALAVGFGMVDQVLRIPTIPSVITVLAGWIVVVLVLLGVILKIIDKFSR